MSPELLPNFSSLARSIKVGSYYEHYKGLRYKILAIARHSETLEELVIYQAQYGEEDVWVRPLAMFLENMTSNEQTFPRFKLISAGPL